MAKVFLDANVLAYLFDDRCPEKQRRAEDILLSGQDFTVSTQVMLELFSVLTRKFDPPLTPVEAEQVLVSLRRLSVVGADENLVMQAVRTVSEQQISIWDAIVLAAARFAGCTELWTEDLAAGATIGGVLIVNPFSG